MTAVRTPQAENIGMGAKAMMVNPTMLVAAEAMRAIPVPWAAWRSACTLSAALVSSSRNLCVMWIE